MGLFKKPTESKNSNENAEVLVLGSGCLNCTKLESNVVEAISDANLNLSVGHIREMKDIVSYGAMSMPALVYKGKLVSSGKILTKEEILKILV